MKVNKTVSLVAIGTELTDGQTLNRNTQWMAQQLTEMGFQVSHHITVPDDRNLILEALRNAETFSGLIFVCGGLGPTTDDFTREVIAKWVNQPTEWDEPSWQRIIARLTQFQIPIADSNRQQCFFPKGAEILPNPEGTASGFVVRARNVCAWILPGPTRELKSIWNTAITPKLTQIAPKSVRRLLKWQCLGNSESALGEIAEAALAGSGLTLGYRAHMPYIEIKVWHDEQAKVDPWIAQLESALAPWMISRGEDDLAKQFWNQMSAVSQISVEDHASGGWIARRLGEARPTNCVTQLNLSSHFGSKPFSEGAIQEYLRTQKSEAPIFFLGAMDDTGTWVIGTRTPDIVVTSYRSPYIGSGTGPSQKLIERQRSLICEIALHRWLHAINVRS